MSIKNLTVHMVVRNEEQWVWYAVQSVLPYIDLLFIYDTGSTDNTVAIIKSIESPKIRFEEKGNVTPTQLVDLRNDQILKTDTSWFMLLDGDEVWTNSGISEVINKLENVDSKALALVSPVVMSVGDLFHFQSEQAGKYKIKGKKGHLNIRLYRKREGFFWRGVYPDEAYVDKDGAPIQNRSEELEFLHEPYWHMTHLFRSSVDSHNKRKLEIGEKETRFLPEVFFKTRPELIPSPWLYLSGQEKILAEVITPIIKLKRILF